MTELIKKRTAIVSMLALGTLAIIFGVRGFLIDITSSVWGIVGLVISILLLLEIGIKRITNLSKLKKLETQQYISIGIAIVVLIASIGLLFGMEIPVILDIANGSFLVGGIAIILEAIRF